MRAGTAADRFANDAQFLCVPFSFSGCARLSVSSIRFRQSTSVGFARHSKDSFVYLLKNIFNILSLSDYFNIYFALCVWVGREGDEGH